MNACEADVIIDILLNQNNAKLVELVPPEQHETISEALATARTFGVEEPTDQVAFCSLWLELGPQFLEIEPWAAPMLELRDGRLTLTDVMTRVGRLETA